jgi:hypothetical protein
VPASDGRRFSDLIDYLYGGIQRAKLQKQPKLFLTLGRLVLHGWELTDVGAMDSDVRGKQHTLKSSAGRWPEFIDGIPTMFASNLEGVIQIDSKTLCTDCQSVPKDHDLLAVQVRSLRTLSAKWGIPAPAGQLCSFRLSKNLWWNPVSNPFEECIAKTKADKNCWTGRLQTHLQSRPTCKEFSARLMKMA